MSLNNQQMTPVQTTLDMGYNFGYTSTTFGLILTNNQGNVHLIWYVGAPTGLFTGVPNGSICFDTTNYHIYCKTGAIGSGSAGAWHQIV